MTEREEKFETAVRNVASCATCRFLVHDGCIVPVESRVGNARFAARLDGRCKRFPPHVVRMREGRREIEYAEYDQPPVTIQVTEFETDGRFWFTVADDDMSHDTPWCGEYVECGDVNFTDIGTLKEKWEEDLQQLTNESSA